MELLQHPRTFRITYDTQILGDDGVVGQRTLPTMVIQAIRAGRYMYCHTVPMLC